MIALHNLHYDAAKLLVEAGASTNGGGLFSIVEARNRVPLLGPQVHPTGAVTELELLSAMLAHGADVMDRLPQPLPDRDAGFAPIPPKTIDMALIRAARSADVERCACSSKAAPILRSTSRRHHSADRGDDGSRASPALIVDPERPTEPEAIAAIDFLLDHGVDASTRPTFGATALHTAALRDYRALHHLAERGANLNVADRPGSRRSTMRSATPPAMCGAAGRDRRGGRRAARARRARRYRQRRQPPRETAAR